MGIATLVTAEQLLRMPEDGCRYELVAGEVRKMTPSGWEHGDVESCLDEMLRRHVRAHRLGRVFVGDPGFLLARDPDTVLAPDIAFIRRERIPAQLPKGAFWPGPPTLAVEVASPNDTLREIDEKAHAWLDAGTQLVWVVNPAWRTVTVYCPTTDPKTLTEDDDLDGEGVVPGFRCRVADLFPNE
jgi:Uma2 family endonuclease